MRHFFFCFFALFLMTGDCSFAQSEKTPYGDLVAKLPVDLTELLAKKDSPDSSGAMGRNRKGYFHVRFQLGMHNLAHYGIAAKNPKAIEYFVKATEYSFQHQLASGGFRHVIPSELRGKGKPSQGDLASGTAFFASSLGSGIHAIETSSWVQNSPRAKAAQQRLATFKPKLQAMLNYLLANRDTLVAMDSHAPNRLLFDGVAFHTLGKLLGNEKALEAASSFIVMAVEQVDESGYFIEGGGFDSSYNGVATNLVYRLLLMGYEEHDLGITGKRAINWQMSRISEEGKISLAGNTRVRDDEKGESFLGRKKGVGVGDTIEALMLSSLFPGNEKYAELARTVRDYYLRTRSD